MVKNKKEAEKTVVEQVEELTNDDRILDLVVDDQEGQTTIVLVNEDRISGSEKSIVKCGIIGQMRLQIGEHEYTFACSLYRKNENYNAKAAAERAAAKKPASSKPRFQATLVA